MRPSDEYVEQAAALGLEMAERDGWIQPAFDACYLDQGGDNYVNFREVHRNGWEETNQFTILWLDRLERIADAAAAEQGVSRDGGAGDRQWESWYFEFREPLLEDLWDAWETKKGMEAGWRKAYDKHTKKKAKK